MALTPERVRHHIAEWTDRLRQSPGCSLWPVHLFHAAHVETAAAILRSGRLSCRSRLGVVEHDVANQGALHNNPRAHDYARLYFRPKNSFHLKTEGVKCLGDPFRDRFHMSIPVLLAFDSFSVLTLPETRFSRDMLSRVRDIGADERFFDSIPFELVYHDGPIEPERKEEILNRRMAEVVVPGELPLEPHLSRIFCRTPLERRTLLHLLGEDAARFRPLVEVNRWLFVGHALYLTRIEFVAGGLFLAWHPPRHRPAGEYSLRILHHLPPQAADVHTLHVPADFSEAVVTDIHPRPMGAWQIDIEEVLAFYAPIPAGRSVLLS